MWKPWSARPEFVVPCANGKELRLGRRTQVMGILNVTPDSFSDGGNYFRVEAAVARAHEMVRGGADILDIGAESTLPGAEVVGAQEEIDRLLPVIVRLVADYPELPSSVDTYKAEVAEAALRAGAAIINDVWGFQHEPEMAEVVGLWGAAAVVMHNTGNRSADDIHASAGASDISQDVCDFFDRTLREATRRGVRTEAIILDPGIGFGKSHQQNGVASLRSPGRCSS